MSPVAGDLCRNIEENTALSWHFVPFLLVCIQPTDVSLISLKLDGMFSYSSTCPEPQRIYVIKQRRVVSD